MIKQETILYEDTYNIHITKDYIDNILIEEKHYDTIGRCTYDYKRKSVHGMVIRYFYTIQDTVYYALVTFNDSQYIKKIIKSDKSRFNNETIYTIDNDICTHLCTYNNKDAIQYIKEYIKTYILINYNLIWATIQTTI